VSQPQRVCMTSGNTPPLHPSTFSTSTLGSSSARVGPVFKMNTDFFKYFFGSSARFMVRKAEYFARKHKKWEGDVAHDISFVVSCIDSPKSTFGLNCEVLGSVKTSVDHITSQLSRFSILIDILDSLEQKTRHTRPLRARPIISGIGDPFPKSAFTYTTARCLSVPRPGRSTNSFRPGLLSESIY